MVSVSNRNKDLPFGGKVVVLGGDFRLASGLEQSTAQELRSFSDWILQIGEGRSGTMEFSCSKFFQDRAILAPTVENVEEINNYIVNLLPGEERNYLSADSICGSDAYSDVDVDWINVEFLNQIRCSGLPNHSLKFKIGMPIILLRNIDPAGGLCNGTRLVVRDLGTNMIGADIVSGSNVGDKVFITRINLIPSDMIIPFKFQRC
ncbi:hypothetical protein Ahy_B09g095793 isoform A [Arachis hypogaea]|uniref:DNA helicase Pif1-like 2B domain-containing protein n=1 Tax=Arachis hypogaea TaxID=3818 RepID=A0A444XGB5_ARAHY|nr:hypothetical protein Ahy_B09g095793 isoform A [Arachis hypogaea]